MTCPARATRHLTAGNAYRGCPLRQRCTTAKSGRTVHLHEHDGLLYAARADRAAGPGLRQDYMTHRPHAGRSHRLGRHLAGTPPKLRYRGVTPNHAWLKRRTAAVNLRTLLTCGLTRRDGAWVLAT